MRCLLFVTAISLAPMAAANAQQATDYDLSAAYCFGDMSQSDANLMAGGVECIYTGTPDNECDMMRNAIARLQGYVLIKSNPTTQAAMALATQRGKSDADEITKLIKMCSERFVANPHGDSTEKCMDDYDTFALRAKYKHCGDVVKQLPF